MNTIKRRPGKWVFLALWVMLMCACEKVVFEPVEIPNDDLSFSIDIQPILDANCTSCHPPTKGLDFTAGNAYNSLVPNFVTAADSANPEGSALYHKLTGTSHGPRTSDVEKLKILKWISQGAPDN